MCILQKNDQDIFYKTLVSRNYGFISEELQQKIRTCRLSFVGCGMSSLLAESAARIGFENITLIDHDTVDLSNLNRQFYNSNELTQPKAICLQRQLTAINPYIKCDIVLDKIETETNLHQMFKDTDIIINTIDYGKNYFDVVEYGREQKKLVVCPCNPCDSGMAIFFNQYSQSIYQFMATEEPLGIIEFPQRLRELYIPNSLPEKLRTTFFNLLLDIKAKGYFPQLIIGVHITTAIVLQYVIKYINQEDIPLAPTIIYRTV